MQPSDAELVAGICAQDASCFELLSNRYRELVFRHVLVLLHDNDASEDVVQETFLRVWQKAEQWQGQGHFKGWLLRTATNLALNHLRSARRRTVQPLEPLLDDFSEDEADQQPFPAWMVDQSTPEPVLLLEQVERGRLLQQLIEGLPAEKREVFRLVHDEQMETRQVAETLGIPEGTVKSRLHYANKRLAHEWRALEHEWKD